MARPAIQRRPATRTCVSCRTEREKADLVRIVRTQSGQNANVEVRVDPTGKASGRGAYLCADSECWSKAIQTKSVQRALEVPSSAELTSLLSAGPPPGLGRPPSANPTSSTSGVTHGA
jgi:predicted RNA-binding protein YlxR (DUF448 family)